MSRRLALLAILAVLAPAARAEDPEGLHLRVFGVGALTQGTTYHIAEHVGLLPPWAVNDEERPLFGAEGEEPILPYGTVDEMIELIKGRVEPAYWQTTEGADIAGMQRDRVVVRASPRVLDQVASFLAELEASALSTVTVEVRTARRAAGGPEASADDLAAASDGPSVVLTAFLGQSATAFTGRQKAVLHGYAATVAQDSAAYDPIVGVANLGLGVRFRASLASEDRLALDLRAQVAELTALREQDLGDRRTIDVPTWRDLVARSVVVVRRGAWTVVQGGAGEDGVVLVRATMMRPAPSAGRPALDLPPQTPPGAGRMVDASFDVSALFVSPWNHIGEVVHLGPSHYTPPEPPELSEPVPFFPPEALAELVKAAWRADAWEEPATIELRSGVLRVRNVREVTGAVGQIVRRVSDEALRTIDVEAVVLSVPAALGRSLTEPARGGPLLDDARRAALEQAPAADVRRLAVLHVQCADGRRGVATAGRRVSYVQGFDTKIAEKSTAVVPISLSVLSGTVVDLLPSLTSTGDAVHVAVRFTRSDVKEPMRTVATPHGPLDAPEMDVVRLRSDVRIPVDATAVVGAGSDGGRAVVLLLTPRIRPD